MHQSLQDTSSKPLVMQQNVGKLTPQDHTEQLQVRGSVKLSMKNTENGY